SRGMLFRDGRQSRKFLRQPFLGLRPSKRHHRNTRHDLHVAECFVGGLGAGTDSRAFFCLRECPPAPQNRALETDFPDVLGCLAEPPSFAIAAATLHGAPMNSISERRAAACAPIRKKIRNGSEQVSHEICRRWGENRSSG